VGDVTDDVSALDAESCLGLVGWLDFYHKVRAAFPLLPCFFNSSTVAKELAGCRGFRSPFHSNIHAALPAHPCCDGNARCLQVSLFT
jgi:hypothetical protein